MVESVPFYFVVRPRTLGIKVQDRGPTVEIWMGTDLPLDEGTVLPGEVPIYTVDY